MLLGWDLENHLPGWGWGQVEELYKPVPRKGLFCLFFFLSILGELWEF